ncbi:MMPL family transporter [Microlunatus panaciterrae]|nr:MMPL family transporter [Microlunatus panaciterrae]
MYRLGRAAYRRRGLTLGAWLVVLIVVGGAAGAFSKAFDDAFTLPGTQSQQALDSMRLTFPQMSGASGQLIFVAPSGQSARSAGLRAEVERTVKDIRAVPQVDTVVSPYDPLISGAVSADDSAAMVSVQFDTQMQNVTESTKSRLEHLAADLQQRVPGSTAQVGGEIYTQTGVQLSIVEVIGVAVALVVLLLTLGSFRAAGMPLATALLGVAISMGLIVFSTAVAKVNSTTPMLALMLGLAVGIDYSLFIVSRHRDQLASGMDPEESAAQSVATAGSAVVFAGLTVMIALAGLSVAGIPFLGTMGVAAAVAVAIAVMIALTLLPALLGFAGGRLPPRSRTPKTRSLARRGSAGLPLSEPRTPARTRFALAWVQAVTRWPVATVVLVIVALGALAIPAGSLRLALPNNGTQAAGTPARVTYDLVTDHFGEGYNGPLIVTADIIQSTDPLGLMKSLAAEIRKLPGVVQVPLATPNRSADTGIIQVIPAAGPSSSETQDLVNRIRAMAPEFNDRYGVDIAVTGATAMQIDVSTRLALALVPFAVLVVGLSLILLTMVFRSIAVPLKATVGYLLSVGAAFGTVALVFEKGWLNGLLNVDQTGPVISFLPIILMGVLFGLAMDYEVFLVSRMRENYVHSGHFAPHERARHAVESGFTSSAKVVVAAAVIMFSVFAAFVPEGEATIKSIALGLAVGVFVDAFVVRMTLVPAVLALLGPKAWYLPRWLDRILPTFDVEGESLQHQLALADWPRPADDHAVYAEGVGVEGRKGGLFSKVDVGLRPGELLVVEDASATAKTALLLALVGRLKIDSGQVKVAGLVLPEQAGLVRRRTAYIDGRDEAAFERRLAAARRAGARVIVIDDADEVRSDTARAALAELVSPASGDAAPADAVAPLDGAPAVLLGVVHRSAVADLVPDSAWQLVLAPPPDPSLGDVPAGRSGASLAAGPGHH